MPDITRREADILAFLAARPDHAASRADLLAAIPDALHLAESLSSQSRRLLSKSFGSSGFEYAVCKAGFSALDAWRESRAKEVYQRAQQEVDEQRREQLRQEDRRKDVVRSWVQWAVATALAVISFFSGAITEKLTGFISVLVSWLPK